MIVFREKRQRRLLFTILLLFALLLLTIFLLQGLQERKIQQQMLNHDNAVITALLTEGMPEDICARAVTAGRTSPEGTALLYKLGIISVSQSHDSFFTASVFPALFAVLFFGSIIFFVLFHFLMKREILYQEASQTITSYTGGDFSHLLPQSENGGLYHLFDKINTMATALQSGQETEKETKTFLKNTVSDISHQLKTPLAALSMYNEIIREEPDNTTAVQTFSEKSLNAVARMEHLIKTLLKLTRLDAGGIEFHMEYHPAEAVIREAIEALTTRAVREHKELSLRGDEETTLYCDKEWTREAIENIVKNALDHTDAGEQIRISWENSPAMTRLTVTDDGAGISEEDIHHIFKRFYRSPDSSDAQGVGLGLPLAKSIMDGQGGFLAVESQKGTGTSFILSFPLKLTKL